MTPGPDRARWSGCLALGPNWLLYTGAVGPTAEHRHHAVQVIAGAAPLTVTIRSAPVTAALIIIPPDVPHQIIGGSPNASVLFVDADTPAADPAPGSARRSAPVLVSDPACLAYAEAAHIADSMLSAIGARPSARRAVSAEVTAAIRLLDDELTTSAAVLAGHVGLSPSELSRRFSREIGIPLRSYRRWRRLVLAIDALAGGTNLTDAAYAAGFSDSAHLTRTFRAMIGIAPSELTGTSRWLEPT